MKIDLNKLQNNVKTVCSPSAIEFNSIRSNLLKKVKFFNDEIKII